MPNSPRRLLVALRVALIAMLLSLGGRTTAATRDRVAYVKDGEVWIIDAAGGTPTRITNTEAKVEDFDVSPSGELIAYRRTFTYADSCAWHEPDEPAEMRSVQSIVVASLTDGRNIAELKPPENQWLYLDRWLPGRGFIGHESSCLDTAGAFEFDLETKQRRDLGREGELVLHGHESADGKVSVYVDDTGLGPTFRDQLHVVDRGTDTIRASKRSILEPRVSHGGKAVAFAEVTEGRKRYWVLRLPKGDLRMVLEAPLTQEVFHPYAILWSLDDRSVAIRTGDSTTIVDTSSAPRPPARVQGMPECWLNATEVVLSSASSIDAYDVTSGERRSIVRHASTARCIVAREK